MLALIRPAQLREGPCLVADFPELGRPCFFRDPQRQWIAWQPRELPEVLAAAERAARAGAWVGGFLTYEAAAAFDLPAVAGGQGLPLAWFAAFGAPRELLWPADSPPLTGAPLPEIDPHRYRADLERIRAWIGAGDTYQVNYTLDARLPDAIDPAALFLHLQPRHRHPYGAWIHCRPGPAGPPLDIASFSPELFLARRQGCLISAPIKGTRPRGCTVEQDAALGRELLASAKDRAEHVMIVDMVRNDLGRVCRTGSIRVPHLMELRSFPTVHHLETRVRGAVAPGMSLEEILGALFPAASITGAPKHRTMAIIRTLEQRPRGLYTGSIGIIRPGGDCIFNVAIRTVVRVGQ
ncbi:MAG: anthranilate synthase component I family protein, partial [Magnetococcales bacterium]|nr:anthranilate synthase component I family protein [Magnetococcales bacterium]